MTEQNLRSGLQSFPIGGIVLKAPIVGSKAELEQRYAKLELIRSHRKNVEV